MRVGALVRQNPKHLHYTCQIGDETKSFGWRRVIVNSGAIGIYLGAEIPPWYPLEIFDLVLFGEEKVYVPLGVLEEIK